MLPCGRLLISGRVERPLKCPNQAEVQDLHGPVEGQEDVVRLHIAVHDAARVRGRESLGDGGPDLEGSPERERSANERHAQRFALEELRDGVRNAPLVADVVGAEAFADVRVQVDLQGHVVGSLDGGGQDSRRPLLKHGHQVIARNLMPRSWAVLHAYLRAFLGRIATI